MSPPTVPTWCVRMPPTSFPCLRKTKCGANGFVSAAPNLGIGGFGFEYENLMSSETRSHEGSHAAKRFEHMSMYMPRRPPARTRPGTIASRTRWPEGASSVVLGVTARR